MNAASGATQITFYYRDGQVESFSIPQPVGEQATTTSQFQMNTRHLLESHWWILHLPERTVFINTNNVLKVEATPPIPNLHGRDVLPLAEQVAPMNSTF
ncbi:MAG: hypothetical protein F6K04_00605 [Leptolyngbya sp. SIO4C5]|uniref:hypothetical protein n=1 Tax=Sphaerothrix gracilis TaxID=3151835 RepID=UPI0013C24F75|nr:hypothetical protein [Leptolyngbya sp. SIO4C5]